MPTTTLNSNEVKNVHCHESMGLVRSKLVQEVLKFNIPLEHLRVHDAYQTNLPTAAAADDLGMVIGTFGTDAVTVQTSDAKATTVTQYARFNFRLPECYDAGESISVAAWAGMKTTVSDSTATLDVECYAKDEADGTVGSDLCTTSATTINSLTLAEKAFTITPTGLLPGDELDVRLTVAITDSATGTAVLGFLTKVYMLLDVRG